MWAHTGEVNIRCVLRGQTGSMNTGWGKPMRHACLRKRPRGQGWPHAGAGGEQHLENWLRGGARGRVWKG